MGEYRADATISAEALTYMDNILKAYEELGVKVYLNIYYQKEIDLPVQSADIVLSHIDQYATLWNKYSKVIYCYNMSLLGRYGEWVKMNPDDVEGDYETITEDQKKQIVHKVLNELPADMQVTMRDPELKVYAEGHSRYSNIGYDQSAFFGSDYLDVEIGQGDFKPYTESYLTAMADAPYAVMFGEAFTTNWFNNNPDYTAIDAWGAIKSMSEQRFGAFNVNHAYGDYESYGRKISDTVMYQWKLKKISSGDLSDLGVLVTDSWFTGVRGNNVVRSAFDYIKDYLGYRISVDNLSVTGGNNVGDTVNISMDLKNYGFSAAFNLESGFAILDENNNVVSEIVAGNPETWYSTNPQNYSDRVQLTHNITANMNLPTNAGTYKIAFFLRNDLGQTARLDNLIEYADGFNILHMFTIN